MPEPATKTHPMVGQQVYHITENIRGLTKYKGATEENSSGAAQELFSRIVNTVDLAMSQFEDTNNVIGPRGDASNHDQNDHTGNYA